MANLDQNRLPQNRRILTIDDNPAIQEDYRKVLLQRESNKSLSEAEALLFGDTDVTQSEPELIFEIDSALQGKEGFELVQKALDDEKPYTCAFVDVRMPPGWDGIETVKRIWEIAADLPIVLCTAYSDHSWEDISRELQRTDQLLFLKKPFDPVALRQLAAAQTTRWCLNRIASYKQEELESLVYERTREISITRDLVFYSLARLAESRDPETGAHLDRIQAYTRLLVEYLAEQGPYQGEIDKKFIEEVCRSSVLHDIGKVGVPDSILLKPGRLTPDEYETMKTHAAIGAEALEDAVKHFDCEGFLQTAAEVARFHHERFDGSGYPNGLSGLNIPLSARIVAVADVFDALTSERVYKKAMLPLDARELINEESESHFDPEIVNAFNNRWEQIELLAKRASKPDLFDDIGQQTADVVKFKFGASGLA